MNPTDPYTQSVPFLRRLRQANLSRQREWGGSDPSNYLFSAVELAGETGELLNAVKKFDRYNRKVDGNTADIKQIKANLLEEIGDVLICLDLLSISLGVVGMPVDIEEATRRKFNKTSSKLNMKTLLFDE